MDKIYNTGSKCAGFIVRIAVCRDENHRDFAGFWVTGQFGKDRITIHFRHHYIKQNQVRGLLPNEFEPLSAGQGKLYLVVVG